MTADNAYSLNIFFEYFRHESHRRYFVLNYLDSCLWHYVRMHKDYKGFILFYFNIEMFGKVHFTKFDFGRDCRFI
jgi:hypothetical protein